MISKAKLVFLVSSSASALIIYKVHEYQNEERIVSSYVTNKFKKKMQK